MKQEIEWKITNTKAYKELQDEPNPSFSSIMAQAQVEAQQQIAEQLNRLNNFLENDFHRELELLGDALRTK